MIEVIQNMFGGWEAITPSGEVLYEGKTEGEARAFKLGADWATERVDNEGEG